MDDDTRELFEMLLTCSEAGSWETMTLEQLEALEAAAAEDGEKDLWVESGGKRITIREEIERRDAEA